MIIHLCIKFQSNASIFSEDIAQKPFVLCTGRTDVRIVMILYAPLPTENGGGIKKLIVGVTNYGQLCDTVLPLVPIISPFYDMLEYENHIFHQE